MRLSPLSQVRSAITGKNRFPVTIRQIQVTWLHQLSITNNNRRPDEELRTIRWEVCPQPRFLSPGCRLLPSVSDIPSRAR